jgi:hypothetical protein
LQINVSISWTLEAVAGIAVFSRSKFNGLNHAARRPKLEVLTCNAKTTSLFALQSDTLPSDYCSDSLQAEELFACADKYQQMSADTD